MKTLIPWMAVIIAPFPPVMAASNPNFVATHFSGSGNCAQCHDGLTDPDLGTVGLVADWSASMMANAASDPYWRAKVASELHRNAGLADEINDRCSRCHAPMANEAIARENAAVAIVGDGMLNPSNPYYDHALDGVSCTTCHQISDDGNLGTLAGFSGGFTIAQHTNAIDRPLYGQYVDPRAGPMQNAVNFTPQFGAHLGDSALCATCHNLKTPYVDSQGNLASGTPETEFPEQMVYSEWLASAFSQGDDARSCQDCHMPVLENPIAIATRPRNLGVRDGVARHTFLGANTAMLDILASNPTELGVAPAGFEASIASTRALLKTSASIDLHSNRVDGNLLEVVFRVRNHIGHKFPTSYPSRRAFIHVTVADQQGDIVFESGRMNADGSIVGNAGDEDSASYEPHYDRITAEDQVQIYEPIMEDTDGAVTHTLLRAARYVKDNRLPPAGFDKDSVSSDIAVRGAAAVDGNFNLGEDLITYAVDLTGMQGRPVVTAELRFQSLAYGHLQDMFRDAPTIPDVATFQRLFEARNILAEEIASVSAVLDAIEAGEETDRDDPDDTGTGAETSADTIDADDADDATSTSDTTDATDATDATGATDATDPMVVVTSPGATGTGSLSLWMALVVSGTRWLGRPKWASR